VELALSVVKEEDAIVGGFGAAGLGPFAAVTVLSPLRDQPLIAGVVVLALITVIATATALSGPWLGAVATVNSALWFNFLFVRPYGVLKFDGPLWPIAALLIAGLAAVAMARRRRAPAGAHPRESAASPPPARHIQRIARLIEEGADERDLVSAVQVELTGLLLARDCRFETAVESSTDTAARPRLERDGTLSGLDGLEPPDRELELPVQIGTHRVGRFLLEPTPGVSIPFDHLLVAVILTDHLAAAIARHTSTPHSRTHEI
jgi:hypothetical protein